MRTRKATQTEIKIYRDFTAPLYEILAEEGAKIGYCGFTELGEYVREEIEAFMHKNNFYAGDYGLRVITKR